ncbi:hypothetical protein Cni_G26872 [Canna indica]|uniref:Uncharacterized protein n=1 Tax=Canna indica TaxID=4628 RepID=A0AAQ3L082_9LILI|nr:hypothetical protein Cni_G26872 [Canna indica]
MGKMGYIDLVLNCALWDTKPRRLGRHSTKKRNSHCLSYDKALTKLLTNGNMELKQEKDTEEVPLPPIEHVEPHGDVIEVDLSADPIHSAAPVSDPNRSRKMAKAMELNANGRRRSREREE